MAFEKTFAFNARYINAKHKEGFSYFSQEVFIRIAQNNPNYEFIFLVDEDSKLEYIKSLSNCKIACFKTKARHPILWQIFNQIFVTRILKKYKVNVYVSVDSFLSYYTRTKQISIIHDLAYKHFPEHFKSSNLIFHRYHIPKSIKKASAIATVSEFTKQDIQSKFQEQLKNKKIEVVFNGIREGFAPLSYEEQQQIRAKYTNDCHYFIYVGAIHPRKNLTRLLKAFSIFKKMQKSEMKLVIVGRNAWKTNEFHESLKTYKYRNDVVLTGYLPEDEVQKLLASAFGLVYVSLFEGFGIPILEAMKVGVPCVVSNNSGMYEVAANAAVLVDPRLPESISKGMQELYKNESLYNHLKELGFKNCDKYSWNNTADLLWQLMLNVATNK